MRLTGRSERTVFPTHVGVFPLLSLSLSTGFCLPHARGGVSDWITYLISVVVSSPRTWGCFHWGNWAFSPAEVFPTHVGVFPSSHATISQESSLPHTCGGVSYRR